MCARYPDPTFVHGLQADEIALVQLDYSAGVKAAIVSFVFQACLHQTKCISIHSECHAVVVRRTGGGVFKKHLGVDMVNTFLCYFHLAMYENEMVESFVLLKLSKNWQEKRNEHNRNKMN